MHMFSEDPEEESEEWLNEILEYDLYAAIARLLEHHGVRDTIRIVQDALDNETKYR